MRVFLDTEFYEFQPKERIFVPESDPVNDVYGPHHITRPMAGANAIQLISIGAVREDGERFYAENAEFDWGIVPRDHWLHENVRPHLNDVERYDVAFIRSEFQRFAGPSPEFWGWYCDYDWVVLCGLFGRMVDLPRGWPMFCHDLRQAVHHASSADLPPKPTRAHHALADAEWVRDAYKQVRI